ncbi:hypothetical protein BDV93DRAFT_547428, partial [Ceratobasidium sp. AG-I]
MATAPDTKLLQLSPLKEGSMKSKKSNKSKPSAGGKSGATSVITAASQLAVKLQPFSDWTDLVKLDPLIKSVPSGNEFKVLLNLVESSKNMPEWILDKDSTHFSPLRKKFSTEIDNLCATARAAHAKFHSMADGQRTGNFTMYSNANNAHPPNAMLQNDHPDTDMTIDDDVTTSAGGASLTDAQDELDIDLVDAMNTILFVARNGTNLLFRSSLCANEAERRIPIDSLLQRLFAEPNTTLMYCLERELRLPKVQGIAVQVTKPDALLVLEFMNLSSFRSAPADLHDRCCCVRHQVVKEALLVVHWLAEYKRDTSGQNQAMMGLVSAVNQRLALGIEDQFIFAMIQHTNEKVKVVAAIRKNQMIQVYKLGEYSLASPLEVTQLFLLHRGIKLLGKQYCDVIRRKGEAFEGIEDKLTDGFINWWKNSSPVLDVASTSNVSSTSGRPTISEATTTESFDEAKEAEPRDRGTLSDKTLGTPYLLLGKTMPCPKCSTTSKPCKIPARQRNNFAQMGFRF